MSAASADDFCLPRLLFPFALPAAEVLPLDDPNMDFVEAPGPAASSAVPAAGCLPVAAAFAPSRRASLSAPSPPLRC